LAFSFEIDRPITTRRPPANAYGPDGPEQMQANTTSGLVFGGDLELFVTKHVVIGPQMRVHWVNRADAPGDPM